VGMVSRGLRRGDSWPTMRVKMGDPHALYIVTAIVVLGLVVWVTIVLSRPGAQDPPIPEKPVPPPAGSAEIQKDDTKS